MVICITDDLSQVHAWLSEKQGITCFKNQNLQYFYDEEYKRVTRKNDNAALRNKRTCSYHVVEMSLTMGRKACREDHNVLLPSVVTQASVLNVTGSKSAVETDQKY